MSAPDPRRSSRMLAAAVVLAAALGGLWMLRSPKPERPPGRSAETSLPVQASFVGSGACAGCHPTQTASWKGSDHERAMAVATAENVLGDFDNASLSSRGVDSRFYRRDGKYFVWTAGPEGKLGEFEIAYTFGVRPLQQYLVPFPGGRLQALPLAWDTGRRRWFDLNSTHSVAPSDWLYWTRNGQNWNGMCAECHSTNLRKNYDSKTGAFDTQWTDINVGCEACHGPGSRHAAWAAAPAAVRPPLADAGLDVRLRDVPASREIENCAACHARRAELGDYDHRGGQLLDQMLPSLLTEGLYWADGQQQDEVYTYGSFLQSKMYSRGVRCTDCHDPHAARGTRAPGNAACVQCHNAAGAAPRPGVDMSGLLKKDYDSPAHHFHRAGTPGSACVDCHAPPRTYMGVDPRHDHSFRIPRPDLSPATGAPNACSGCHSGRSAAWAAATVARWYGPARRRESHYGEVLASARAGKVEAGAALRSLAADSAQAVIVRATALDLLQQYPGVETTAVVSAALGDPQPLLRHTAAAAVQGLPWPAAESAAALAPLLRDPVRSVRLAAAASLAGPARESLDAASAQAFERDLVDYRDAMERSLDFASSGLNLGNLSLRLGQPAEAERYFRQALAVDPLFFPAKVNLAMLLAAGGRNDEAERQLREVLGPYPDNADAAYALGLLLVETGRSEEAAGWLRHAVERMPTNVRARYNLGLLLGQLGRVAEARATLAAALTLAPTDFDLLFALADLELRDGHAGVALALADRMIAVRPSDPTGAQVRAAAERLSGSPR